MKADFILAGVFVLCVAIIPLTAIGQTTAVALPTENSKQDKQPDQSSQGESESNHAALDDFKGRKKSFDILDQSSGKVLKVSARDFVRGAVAAEMPASYNPEALKAQAVAAYTYAIRQSMIQDENPSPELKGADFSADPNNYKVYINENIAKEFYGDNFDVLWTKVCKAADSVEGEILTFNGLPLAAAYHAISCGKTEDAGYIWGAALPCITAVESEGDIYAPGFASQEIFSKEKMIQTLTGAYPDMALATSPEAWLEILERSPSNYVTKIKAGDRELEGRELRTLLGLRSTCFEIKYLGGNFIFDVKGYGHGAGLSQYGADYMARQGKDYMEILAHYYPGSQLNK